MARVHVTISHKPSEPGAMGETGRTSAACDDKSQETYLPTAPRPVASGRAQADLRRAHAARDGPALGLNLSVRKYILDEGLLPLSYATLRYGLAGVIFVALTLLVERTLRIERRHLVIVAIATVTLWLNQVCFVLALDETTASTIGLLLGAIPIFAALFGLVLGRETLSRRFWLGAAVSFLGVGLVAVGSGGELSGGYLGIALGLGVCATWAGYSVAVAPLMTTYSPSRVSAVVIPCAWLLVAIAGSDRWSSRTSSGSG